MWTIATVAPTAATVTTATMVKWRNIQSCRQSKCLPHLLHIPPPYRTPSLFSSPFLQLPHSPSLGLLLTHLSLFLARAFMHNFYLQISASVALVCVHCVCVCVRLLCCTIWKVRLKLTEILRNVQNSLWRRVAATETNAATSRAAWTCAFMFAFAHPADSHSRGYIRRTEREQLQYYTPFTGYLARRACPLGAPQLSPLLYCAH